MYQSFFQFSQLPFQITPNPYFFFFSKHHEEALSHVTYGIQERKGFILITGEVGTGKTTLCRLLLERLGPGVKTSLIFNPNLATLELLQSINQDFGLGGVSSSKKELVDELNHFLLKELQNGGNAVLIIDEAQNLPAQCLEEIRMLSNLETQDAKLLQILLVGQPELRDKLAVPELRQLNQRIALRYHLLPLTEDEVRGYIAYRLRMANGGERVFFTPEAMGAIYRYSGGIPRLINILCDKALLAAFVAESRVVSKEIVGDAISDLEGLVKGRRSHRIKGAAPFPPDQWHAVEKLKQRVSPIGLGILIFFFLSILGGVAFWWLTQLPDPSLREARVEESQPVPLPARVEGIRPDSDGIFREESAEDSRRGALLTLMALWDPRFYEDALWDRMKEAGSDVMGLVRSEGFELVPISMELELVNRLDYPVLMELDEGVERGRHSAVLWQIQGEEALVLDPLRGGHDRRRD